MFVPYNIQLKCCLTKNIKRRYEVRICMGEAEDQGLGEWKIASDRGESLTKIELVVDIK